MVISNVQKFFLVLGIFIIGLIIYLFGSVKIIEYLNEKNSIVSTIAQKIQIIESVKASDKLEFQRVGNATMDTYHKTVSELCRKQYFYLKTECELTDLSKSNLWTINKILETGIRKIIEVQDTQLE